MTPRPHRHLIIDADVSFSPIDEVFMKELLERIIKSIGMKVAVLSNNQPNPISWYCDDPDNRGYTGSAILTTSHCAIHFWDDCSPNKMHFDLYTCSDLDRDKIITLLHDEFGIIKGTYKFIDRNRFWSFRMGKINPRKYDLLITNGVHRLSR